MEPCFTPLIRQTLGIVVTAESSGGGKRNVGLAGLRILIGNGFHGLVEESKVPDRMRNKKGSVNCPE